MARSLTRARAVPDPSLLPRIHGVDFTSRPRRGKPVTIANGHREGSAFVLTGIDELPDFPSLEQWLSRPGPWIGGFDFPFGLPRAAVEDLGWPTDWPALVRHVAGLGRETFRQTLDAYREGRAVGDKNPYRRGDAAAGSHSPVKLVNPPVALMFLEGAPRLAAAGVAIPGILPGDGTRIALEAYPGYAVRQLLGGRARLSYKNDARAKQTPEQRLVRTAILRRLEADANPLGLRLEAGDVLMRSLLDDATGDRLDCVLCALQAAWAWQRRDAGYGLPAGVDPLEGWIVTVPG